jgi:hypothetical protein
MFNGGLSGDLWLANTRLAGSESNMAILNRRHHWLFIIWVVIGLIVAWERTYITLYWVKLVLSALLTVFLWPLALLGVNLHIH